MTATIKISLIKRKKKESRI